MIHYWFQDVSGHVDPNQAKIQHSSTQTSALKGPTEATTSQ